LTTELVTSELACLWKNLPKFSNEEAVHYERSSSMTQFHREKYERYLKRTKYKPVTSIN
jgi:hypothetical protein